MENDGTGRDVLTEGDEVGCGTEDCVPILVLPWAETEILRLEVPGIGGVLNG